MKTEVFFEFEKDFKIIHDIHPCDELPVVGEFGKLGKVLSCAGWLNNSVSPFAWTAQNMVDMLLHDKKELVHPLLHPRRFLRRQAI